MLLLFEFKFCKVDASAVGHDPQSVLAGRQHDAFADRRCVAVPGFARRNRDLGNAKDRQDNNRWKQKIKFLHKRLLDLLIVRLVIYIIIVKKVLCQEKERIWTSINQFVFTHCLIICIPKTGAPTFLSIIYKKHPLIFIFLLNIFKFP